jgi:hypothetical protein
MKKSILVLTMGLLFMATMSFAAGDLVVNGNLGVGTGTPGQKLEVDAGDILVKGAGNWGTDGNDAKLLFGDSNHFIKAVRGYGLKIGTWSASDGICLQQGNGYVGIGTSTPPDKLAVYAGNVFIYGPNNFTNAGDEAKLTFGDSNHFIECLKGTGIVIGTYQAATGIVLHETTGYTGIGTNAPTGRLDVNGATGYNQVRMRTSYTPTGTADGNGNTGDIAWDAGYVYIKTGSGWKRAALSTF